MLEQSRPQRSNPNNNADTTVVNIIDRRTSHPNIYQLIFIRSFHSIQRDWRNNGSLKFMLVSLGIFISLIVFGVLEEKLMQGCYGDEDKKSCPHNKQFKYATTMVGSQMFCAFIMGKILNLINLEERKDETPETNYIFGALINAASMITCVLSLRWVSYPLEIVVKSSKPVAVMIFNLLVCKRYPIQKYFFVIMIVVGVLMFKLFEATEKKYTKQEPFLSANNWERFAGIGLLIVSLCMDGMLGAIQDHIRDRYSPTFRQMMSSMTGYIALTTAIIITGSGEIFDVLSFVTHYPIVILHLFIICIAGAFGQLFIFIMLTSFGALATSVMTTVRKLFTIIISVVYYGNPSTLIQWIGATLVFTALLADAFFSHWKRNQLVHESEIPASYRKSPENEGNHV